MRRKRGEELFWQQCCVFLSYRDYEAIIGVKNLVSHLVNGGGQVGFSRWQFSVGIHFQALTRSLEGRALLPALFGEDQPSGTDTSVR